MSDETKTVTPEQMKRGMSPDRGDWRQYLDDELEEE